MWSDFIFAFSLVGIVVYYAHRQCKKKTQTKTTNIIEMNGSKLNLKSFLQNLDAKDSEIQGH